MSIYVVANMKVLDPSFLEAYGAIAGPLVKQYGGEYVAQSAAPEIVEGDWPEGFQTIILKWPSREAFRAFWDSPEYAKAKEIRKGKVILHNVILDAAG